MSSDATVGGGARPEDFRDPIAFFHGVHERLRRVCENLVRLAENPAAAEAHEIAAMALDFLQNELPLHRADEEDDLFPLLEERRQRPATVEHDELLSALEVLRREHRYDVEHGRSLLAPLGVIAAGQAPRNPEMFSDYLRAFVKRQRGHLAMEDRLVLPVASERLTPEDLAWMARRMAARRGLRIAG